MPKVLKRKVIRKSANRKPKPRRIHKPVKRTESHSGYELREAQKNTVNGDPSKDISLRDSMILRQMMGQQRPGMSVQQAPQSAIDGLKHEYTNSISKIKEEFALEKQKRIAQQNAIEKENYKNKTEAKFALEDRANVSKNEAEKLKTKRLQEQARGEGITAEYKQTNAILEETVAQRQHQKKMNEEQLKQEKEKGNTLELKNRIKSLDNDLKIQYETLNALSKNTPEKDQEDEAVTGLMGKLLEGTQKLIKELHETFLTKGEWDMIKAQKAPSMILKIQGDIANYKRQTAVLQRNITRKEGEINERYELEDEARTIERRKNEKEAEYNALDAHSKQNISVDSKVMTRDEYNKALRETKNTHQIALHNFEQNTRILRQNQEHFDNIELEINEINQLIADEQAAIDVHTALDTEATNKNEPTRKEKLVALSQNKVTKVDELETLKVKNSEDRMIRDALNERTVKTKAIEIELLEQQSVYDANNPNSTPNVTAIKKLTQKTAEAEQKRLQTTQLKKLADTQKQLLDNQTALQVQSRLNTITADPEESVNQAISDNIAVNKSIDESIQKRTLYQSQYSTIINNDQKLANLLNLSQESFNDYSIKEQASMINALNKGLKRDYQDVIAFDNANSTTLKSVFEQYWTPIPIPSE